jgi:Phosphotransferase enzyme family
MTDRDPDFATQDEVALTGGWVTQGVVRVGDTVRRPTRPRSQFVHELLLHRRSRASRPLRDSWGWTVRVERSSLSSRAPSRPTSVPGTTTTNSSLQGSSSIRYHEATAGSHLAGTEEVVCHNDVSPVNTVFLESTPVAMIDFDAAAPGPRIRDVAYGAFLWLNLGWDGPEPDEQHRRLHLWRDACGIPDRAPLIDWVKTRILETVASLIRSDAKEAAQWWNHQLSWMERYEAALR